VLRYLDNFSVEHNIPKKYRFAPSKKILSVIGDDIIDTVSDGCLCHFETKVRKSIDRCQVLDKDGDHVVIREKTAKIVQFKLRTRTKSQRFRWKRVFSVLTGGLTGLKTSLCALAMSPFMGVFLVPIL